MQDAYVGDVGDFGKYGLLRFLCNGHGAERLQLAVNWYFVSAGGAAHDGKFVGYLEDLKAPYRCCDEKLFDSIQKLLIDTDGDLIDGNRRISLIENLAIFPNGTTFYGNALCLKAATVEKRREERQAWISNALQETGNADLVFLDPDNGIACASARPTAPKKGPKYVFWDEILAYAKRGQSVVVYHHLCRSGKHDDQVRSLTSKFGTQMPFGFKTRSLIFNRGNGRAYFIVMSPQHRSCLSPRVSKFMSSNWKEHFREVE